MERTDNDKLQLRKMLASEWWKILESIVNETMNLYDKQILSNVKDYTTIREKKYDELNVIWALKQWMSLVLKAPYEILNREAEDHIVEQMNEKYRQDVKKLER